MAPQTRYARSGDLSIAYQVVGDGPIDLVHGTGAVSHVEYHWEEPGFARFLRRLAAFSRLIIFDKRGTGLSDRTPGIATLEERMDDIRAVMDAASSARAVLFGVSESAPLATLFAATYPERADGLILYTAYAAEVRAPDYPWPPTAAEFAADLDKRAQTIHEDWGQVDSLADLAPSVAGNPAFRTWFRTLLRLGASRGAAIALDRMNAEIDVRHVLPAIRVPTLVLHRLDTSCYRPEEGRYVAARIPGARLVELPGSDYFHFVGDSDALVDEIEAFVTGTRPVSVGSHVLATVLALEITDPVRQAASLGDQRWGELQAQFLRQVDRALDRFRGQTLDMSGDRVMATFDGPARAIRCAAAILDASRGLGLATRAGLHTGECEVRDDRVSGVAVHLASWVASQAMPDEILVSGTVKDLVAGANLRFEKRGSGIPGDSLDEWLLFAARLNSTGDPTTTSQQIVWSRPVHPLDTLTRREREVLPLVAHGLSNLQIADALSIGERTVESHVASILAKWNLPSRTRLAAAMTLGDATPRP